MTRDEIVQHALTIADEYRYQHNMVLTLRQLYYQFVARGLLPNGQKVYKRIGSTLTDARLNGSFPLDGLEDRGRTVGPTDAECAEDVDEAITNAAKSLRRLPYWLRYGPWHNQPYKVFVWIEKEALAGVVEPVCDRLGVGLFPCRGYPSVSSLAHWVRTAYEQVDDGEEAVILYLGDHDPDGLQIPLSAEETIRTIMGLEGTRFDFTMERIALTLPQIQAFNPPPMPAKITSARFDKYLRTTGMTDAWELDALDPPKLRNLVETEVGRYFDESIHRANRNRIADLREEMVDRITDDPDWMEEQLRFNF
jgi:hypothetical protein